jgi:thioredoxin 1
MTSVRLVSVVAAIVCAAGCADESVVRPLEHDDFEREVLRSSTPTVVEFWARGCMPCVALARPLNRVARAYEGRVAFRKLNVGWTAETRYRYHFDAVPTLILYRDGREAARLVGKPEGDVYLGLVAFVESGLAVRP